MSVVLVHGNPETPIIWEPLLAQLGRTDVHAPQLPGFGCAAPAGFGATKEEYTTWLTATVEEIVERDGPVDIVGHDWGALLTMGVVAARPELFRSWVDDALGVFHEDYVWHDFAQMWQTPEAGEAYFARVNSLPAEERVVAYEGIGIPRSIGERLVALADDEMARCVLALYRSAAQPAMAEWGRQLGPAATRPGLALIAENDPFVRGLDLAPIVAERLGATTHVLSGQGHWWMLGDPSGAASVLTTFWNGL
jgi:pimeloyl-ACP methyl ester carboxylesterase